MSQERRGTSGPCALMEESRSLGGWYCSHVALVILGGCGMAFDGNELMTRAEAEFPE